MTNTSDKTTSLVTQTQLVRVERKVPAKRSNLPIEVPQDVAVKCNNLRNTSQQIRFLGKMGYKEGQIANILGIRYQHAYNVLHQIVKNEHNK